MNIFLQKILKAVSKDENIHQEIISFSHELSNASGLRPKDIEIADRKDISWEIGPYILYAVGHQFTGWESILEVVPSGHNICHGYSNMPNIEMPIGWHYKEKGANTEILPDKVTREKIIKFILDTRTNEINLDPDIWNV